VALATAQFALPKQAPTEKERLPAVGKLWVTIKYFHPYLAYRDIDWDKALVEALPKIRAAGNSAEYRAAVQSMLDALHDPATYAVVKGSEESAASLKIDRQPNGMVIVSQTSGSPTNRKQASELAKAIASASTVVFDLRVPAGSPDYLSQLLDDDGVSKELSRVPLDAPPQRLWIHNGLTAASGSTLFSDYHSAFYTKSGLHLPNDPSAQDRKVAFILNENSPLPAIGSALLANGKAVVLAESPHYQISGVETAAIPMGEDVEAIVRLSEPLVSQQVRTVPHDNALDQAAAALSKPLVTPSANPLPAYPSPRPDQAYSDVRYPSVEYRILAAYKIWGVFRYFFAYRDLMDEDWDDIFVRFFPKFIAAKDAREYNLTIAEMVAYTADSHSYIRSDELTDYFGKSPVGLRLRLIEKKPVITQILDEDATKAGIQAGDIVSKVDGESIIDRFNRESPYVSSSTPQWHGYRVMQQILNGPEGSMAALTIGGQDGRTREVSLKRASSYSTVLRDQRTGEVIKLLPGNIGYADLDRLTPEQVDEMFNKFRDTKAIIFDVRGYPHGTAWSIAPRLTAEKDVAAAVFTGPLSLGPDLPLGDMLTSTASYFFVQRLPTTDQWKYKGKTVMLIDERTISQAEHTGLFFEAANKTEFIGTPSAGANGDVTNFVVPGGITINFSGHDVRHANGGKLQRLGLQPSVTVAPSIRGIREGRDEVLEKAIEYVSK